MKLRRAPIGGNQAASLVVAVFTCTLLVSCGIGPSFNASISLAGKVIDERGEPLNEVRLDVRENRFNMFSESFLSDEETVHELRDGRFQIACKPCSSMNLHFSKKGYYSETANFHVETPDGSDNRDRPETAQDLVLTDLEIVLRSSENQATLVRYESRLHTAADGPVKVAPLRRDLGSRGVEPHRLDKLPSREAQYLPGYVRLLAAVNDEGVLAAHPLPDRPGARMRFPVPAVVDFTQADGGIVFYRMAEGNPAKVYREMRTAPDDGYQDSLVLDGSRYSGSYYFYCRIGDRYGKGMIGQPSFGHTDDGREVVMTNIELRLNLDGSRNIETAR